MKLSKLKKMNLADLIVRREVNFRDDYDIPQMKEDIAAKLRIIEPIYVKEDGTVMKGNRRTLAGQEWLADPKCPADLLKNLTQVDVFVCSEMSKNEEMELILDHGSQKHLTRVEVVKAAWRLQREMYTERDIILVLYNQLAEYTGNTRKAYEAQALPAGESREKFLKDWLHGTVGNYIMYAGTMGPRVRDQFILTDLAMDRALTEEEKARVEFNTSRKRIGLLNSAKNEDKKVGGWSPDNGGQTFNALIEKFIAEDKNPTPRGKGFTSAQMEETADAMQSDLRIAFLKCAGKLPDGDAGKVEALDCKLHRQSKIDAITTANIDRINPDLTFTGAQVKALLQSSLFGAPEVYEERFNAFCG